MKFIIELEFIGEPKENSCEIYKELHELFDYFGIAYFRNFFRQIHMGNFVTDGDIIYKEIEKEKKEGSRERPPT